jgi:uncharacterized protein
MTVPAETIDHVVKIIENISFKGGCLHVSSIELDIVQDADRLDYRAIGIARAFNYGGFKKALHDPTIAQTLQ